MSAVGQIAGWALFLAVAFLWVLLIGLCRARARHLQSHRPADDSTGSAGRCNQHRPHRIIPDDLGWSCSNDGCEERWYVDEVLDKVAVADLALWEFENDWQVQA